jgi:hypothetical protein
VGSGSELGDRLWVGRSSVRGKRIVRGYYCSGVESWCHGCRGDGSVNSRLFLNV